jgi:hypothetical protein
MNTYAEATSQLTLKRHIATGDALLLVSISTQGKSVTETTKEAAPLNTDKKIEDYLNLHIDSVLTFHEKAKGGLSSGAKVMRVLPQARPEDVEAGGYNVLMKYPPLTKEPTVNETASLGTQLIEASLLYAHQHNIQAVFAYSRPAGFRVWVAQQKSV